MRSFKQYGHNDILKNPRPVVETWRAGMERESMEGWREVEVPYITLDPSWKISVIPPFNGAAARFLIGHKNDEDVYVSVYLDTCEALGCSEDVYWETYPVDGCVHRCSLENVEELKKTIRKSIRQQIRNVRK